MPNAHTPITSISIGILFIALGSFMALTTCRLSAVQHAQCVDTERIIDHLDHLTGLVDIIVLKPAPEGCYTPLALEMGEEIANVNRTLPYRDAIRLGEAIEQASEHYNLDLRVILGVILAESTAKPGARNGSCFGPMQVNVRVWDRLLR